MSPDRRSMLLAGAAALVSTGLAGCATAVRVAGPATPPPPPTVRVGDRWRYARTNLYNDTALPEQVMRVTAIAPQLRVEVTDGSGPQPAEVYADPWRVIQEPAYDMVQVFETPCPLLPARLEPGATERYAGRYRPAGDDTLRFWSTWVDAQQWERVQVPAGSFDALRVTRRIAFQHANTVRIDPRRVETLWYAPQVNRWVRRVWTGEYTLPGFPQPRLREDWVAWDLIEYAPA